MTAVKKKKSFTMIVLCMGIISPAVFLFSLAADLPHVLIITLTGLFLSLLTRKTVKLNDRTVIYSVVIAFTIAVLFDYVFPMADDRFEYLSSLFRLNITIPALFYLAVAVTFFGIKKYAYAAASVAAVIALSFGSNVMRMPVETERFLFVGIVLQHFEALYIFCIVYSGLFILLACRNSVQVKTARELRKYRSRKMLIFICVLVLIIPAAYGFNRLIVYFERDLRSLQNTLLNPKMFKNRGDKIVFGQSANLNEIISPEILNNQEQIVIRALSRNEPGYLRGKAYTFYADGHWLASKSPGTITMRLRDDNGLDYKTFSINKKPKAKYSIEILTSSRLASKALFLPGDFTQIDIIAGSLKYTENGNVTFEDWITDGGYTVYRPDKTADSAWPQPGAPDMALYTQAPDALGKELDQILAKLPELKNPELNDQRRIFILLKYFQDNFKYKIRQQPVNPVDPILSFLKETRQGHCEFYATGMILLLRRLGIPARYITGFICAERHPLDNYYVARLGNAHAWVEAFDRDKRQWQLVEPTPPSGTPNYRHRWSAFELWSDIFKKSFQQLLSNMRRGYFARAIIDFFVMFWRLIVLICYDWIRGPILAALFIAAAACYIRRRRKNRKVKHDYDNPEEIFIELGKTYQKIQKQLKSKYELDLSVSSTINDFIIELSRSDMPEPQKTSLTGLLREYEAMRYLKTSPPREAFLDFKNRFHL